ncbi:MAG: S8 family peptidase, partial [Proteobacteria bacterium]|nr:S8 family peptidase [Pseudomonadota bacterium]
MKLPPGANVEAFVQKLKKERHIEYAEPNYKRKPLGVIPDDPSWSQQWGMEKISMPYAWEINKGSKNVIVAVIDTGVDYNHPDLTGNIWNNTADSSINGIDDDGNTRIDDIRGWNFYCPDNTDNISCEGDNNPMDTYGHGTNVAGVIGATGNNGTGVTGVNWNVTIMPLKFMDGTGGVAAEVKAIDYAITMGAKVINASYGDDTFSIAEYEAIKHAAEHGILVVAAAGNSSINNDSSESRNYPASYSIKNTIGTNVFPPLSNIISVAATIKDDPLDPNKDDALASSSNYGATSVHLGAPGSSIYSTYKNGGYQSTSGTSMATPFVTGTAALLWAQRPAATYTQIKEAILQSVDTVPALADKVLTGGRLNAFKALQKINEFFVEIPLQTGWNFISTPIEPIDPSMNAVLKDISPNVRIIWGYNNEQKQWLSYRGQGSGVRVQNTLTSIEAGKGYWAYMDNPATLTISGQPTTLSPQSVSLYNGWNLVG